VYRGELGEVVYDFTWPRNRDGPLKMLTTYRGYLQVDAVPAYDDVFAQHPDIIEVGCWAHARRYFKEAMPTAAVPCAQVLAIIGQLYGIERAASDKHLDALARQRLRQEQSRPILEKLHGYLQEQQVTALPKSPLGAAIGYALCNWVALTRYTEDGHLKPDNNGAEQAMRAIVLGRSNWLFAGSEAAAHRIAILCSLVQTCKHLRINPFVHLRDVIERVSTHQASHLGADATRVDCGNTRSPKRSPQGITPRLWTRLFAPAALKSRKRQPEQPEGDGAMRGLRGHHVPGLLDRSHPGHHEATPPRRKHRGGCHRTNVRRSPRDRPRRLTDYSARRSVS
jgi:hypothetical protein